MFFISDHSMIACNNFFSWLLAGTGKTLLARAAAAECGASFLAIQPSTVASKWLGDGVRYVRAVFSLAAKLSPCVLFVDEVDALLGKAPTHPPTHTQRKVLPIFTRILLGLARQ